MQICIVTTAQTLILYIFWDKFERFSTRKFAITFLPSDNVPAPLNLSFALPSNNRFVYLMYYRALSYCLLKDKRNCDQCMVKHRLSLQTFCCCRQSERNCYCIAFKRQPPFLRDICPDIYFRDIRHFILLHS